MSEMGQYELRAPGGQSIVVTKELFEALRKASQEKLSAVLTVATANGGIASVELQAKWKYK